MGRLHAMAEDYLYRLHRRRDQAVVVGEHQPPLRLFFPLWSFPGCHCPYD